MFDSYDVDCYSNCVSVLSFILKRTGLYYLLDFK